MVTVTFLDIYVYKFCLDIASFLNTDTNKNMAEFTIT
jgi:hypothetical protein